MMTSATELVDGYRNKTISPVEATEALGGGPVHRITDDGVVEEGTDR